MAKEQELEKKRKEIIEKFNKQFIDNNFNTDPTTHKVIELLIRDVNPYTIIEHLITVNQDLIRGFDELIRKG